MARVSGVDWKHALANCHPFEANSPTPGQQRVKRLVDLAARLRAPDGCPWDREQRLADVRAFLIEEAHEVAAAIDSEDWSSISEELGDLLFQIAFIVRLGEESDHTSLDGVVEGIHRKMVDRHPHVFGDESLPDAKAVRQAWERRKVADPKRGVLDGVPASLPALVGAYRMSQKAAGVGFDWTEVSSVAAKVHEELAEVEQELESESRDQEALKEELGDLLFAVANLARHLHIDPEGALAGANQKFRRRFESIEAALREHGQPIGDAGLEEMEALWQRAKDQEAKERGHRSEPGE
ncbi:MAG: nucleoside triphosphate pyrophosphohydrolase [Thermoanaerobaculia bacterium]|nr:nucleoside triphosphate pyrophosphohydrolase [Thermoanaerobaculia bacterium]